MQNNIVKKTLVFVIIALFIGIAIQPGMSANSVPEEEKTNVEPKDYLYQTVIDIANNPEVKDLLNQINKKNFFSNDFDSRDVILKLLFKKPGILLSTLFTIPTISYKYLNFAYHQGCEITDVIGEDKTLEIVESINITNLQIFDSLTCIVMNNTELRSRIETLEIMNNELNSDNPPYPIICKILEMIVIVSIFILVYVPIIKSHFRENSLIYRWLTSLYCMSDLFGSFIYVIALLLDCTEAPEPP